MERLIQLDVVKLPVISLDDISPGADGFASAPVKNKGRDIYVLGTGGLVDGKGSSESVSAFSETSGISAFRVPRRSRRTISPRSVKPS
jgi:hypothetical protein